MRKNLSPIHPPAAEALDRYDRQLLSRLQAEGRATNAALAREIHLAEAPTWRRVKALEEAGIIRGYRAEIEPRSLGLEVTAFVQVRFVSNDLALQRAFEDSIGAIEQVLWCHNISGSNDFLLCVLARNLVEYGELLQTRIRALQGVMSVESSFSLKTVKSFAGVPVPAI